MKKIEEDAPTNSAGAGQIDGIGVGPRGEPGGNIKRLLKQMLRRNMPNATKSPPGYKNK